MEKNNLHKAYIYIIAIFAIGVAMSNIISFFNGVGFAFIGASVLLALAITSILKDETHKKRFGDILVLLVLEFLIFIVLFFAYDFNFNGITNKFPLVMRNICAIYSLLAIAYVLFRYISEIKGVKYVFVEYMLGNYIPAPSAKKEKKAKNKAEIKKNKELENGTLAPKPSSIDATREEDLSSNTDIVVEQSSDDVDTEQDDVEDENKDIEEPSEDNNAKEENGSGNNTSDNSNVGNRTNFWY